MACSYCKTGVTRRVYPDIPNTRRCNVCGGVYSKDDTGVTDLIYGSSWKERCAVRYALSDRYLILHVNRGAEKPRGGLLLGAIVSSAVQMSREGKTRYGFYDLAELRHVVYPYRTRKIKGDEALRFVFRDGSDFILKRGYGHWTGACAFLKEAGVEIVDGSDRNFGDRYCEKPFINENTADVRVCATAAREIQMMEGNLEVPLIGGAEAAQKPGKCAPLLQTIFDLGLPVGAVEDLKKKNLILLKDLLSKTVPELRAMGIKEATLLQLSTAREKFGLIQGEGFDQLRKPPHVPEETASSAAAADQTAPTAAPTGHATPTAAPTANPYTVPSAAPSAGTVWHAAVATQLSPEPAVTQSSPQPTVTAAPPANEAPQPVAAALATEPAVTAALASIPTPESTAPASTSETEQPRRERKYKFCHSCGEKLEPEDTFCPECGTKQRR